MLSQHAGLILFGEITKITVLANDQRKRYTENVAQSNVNSYVAHKNLNSNIISLK